MQLVDNSVMVTGGASGIGLAIADRFLKAGSDVVVCGRRAEELREAKAAHPGFHTRVCDLGRAPEREALAAWAVREFPRLNVLVNNAGIQRRVRLADQETWDLTREEIAINFDAPVHLSRLLIPHLVNQPRAAIINVTSGLSFSPIAAVPVYCATKAALHSFTLSLRHQLKDTPIRVVEIIPPAVDTDLGGPGLHTFGASVNEFADAVMAKIQAGALETVYGFSEQASRASRQALDEMFQRMNAGRG